VSFFCAETNDQQSNGVPALKEKAGLLVSPTLSKPLPGLVLYSTNNMQSQFADFVQIQRNDFSVRQGDEPLAASHPPSASLSLSLAIRQTAHHRHGFASGDCPGSPAFFDVDVAFMCLAIFVRFRSEVFWNTCEP
jgi:hypothetical protein